MSSRSGRPSSLLLWPAGAEIGRTAGALRGPSFIPTVRSAPEWALRLHRVMRRRALAGFTADQGVPPLPRRPRPDYQVASAFWLIPRGPGSSAVGRNLDGH